nr:hypothetical protein [Tanacetum cinerariifolium]
MVADSLRWDERSRSSQVRALGMLEYMIVVGAENRPPMLDKKMYNSWQSCILLYLIGKENENLTIQEIKLPFRMVELLFNKFKEDRVRVLLVWEPREMLQVQEETTQLVKQGLLSVITAKVKRIWQGSVRSQKGQGILHDNLDAYDSDYDDISSAKAVLMANLLSYDSDVLSEKAQRIRPTLYDEIVISKKHDVTSVVDEEKTLILEEESRSKILAKQNEPISKEKKVNISPFDYNKLNKLAIDFGKHFVPQMQMSAEQAFWLPLSNP